MAPTVYLETSVISYLTSRPSRDVVTAAHQQLTLGWWNGAHGGERNGLPPHLELQAHCKRADSRADRALPARQGLHSTGSLHAGRTHGALTVTEPQREDPIIEEVRRNREELLRAAGGSLDALYAALRDSESKESRKVVAMPPRKYGGPESDAA